MPTFLTRPVPPAPTLGDVAARARLEAAFDPVRAAVAAGQLPAAVMAVATRDRLLRLDAFARPRGDRVTTRHLFFIASVTKPIVATAVLQLVDAGLLDLHEPIARHIPEFVPAGGSKISAWHLLTHTSGVRDVPPLLIPTQRPTASAMLRYVCETPVGFEPGTRFEYASTSFYLLAELITRLSGHPYPQYLHQRIFEPLGMVDTSFDPRHSRRRITPLHGVGIDNRIKKEFALRYFASIAVPGGGLWSTASDLVTFGQTLLAGGARGDYRLLSPELVELMTRDHAAGTPQIIDGAAQPARYGLGWGKPGWDGIALASPRVFHHGGATGTRLWIDPDNDLVFVFLSNQWDADITPMIEALRGVYATLAT